jgi:hypothetical protein
VKAMTSSSLYKLLVVAGTPQRSHGFHSSIIGQRSVRNFMTTISNPKIKGSVYCYNNFQQIVVRIAAILILTTNGITESIQ